MPIRRQEMTAMGAPLSTEQLSKAWVAIELRPSTTAELQHALNQAQARLEELRSMPMVTDYRIH